MTDDYQLQIIGLTITELHQVHRLEAWLMGICFSLPAIISNLIIYLVVIHLATIATTTVKLGISMLTIFSAPVIIGGLIIIIRQLLTYVWCQFHKKTSVWL
ncbi:hypothetical protein [Lactiplantibacillus mudanjiangensis]|nr:hypothetical protein [Lactiplantibacillus mudanjiangensis]